MAGGQSAGDYRERVGPRARARDGLENQRPWPADKVERWQIDRLIPYAKKKHGPTRDAQAVLGISESEYVTRFTNVTYTDWVMRCTPRKVLRTAEQEPVVLPPAKAQRKPQAL